MKQTRRFLSIVLMLAMLLSMFTVLAYAGDTCGGVGVNVKHGANDKWTEYPAREATCGETGRPAYYECGYCGMFVYKDGDDYYTVADVHDIPTTPATGNHQNLVYEKEQDGVKAHYVCADCGEWFWDKDAHQPITNPEDAYIPTTGSTSSCQHKRAVFHEAEKGYSAYVYCRDCRKYFAALTEDRLTWDLSNPHSSKEDFKLDEVNDGSTQYTLTIDTTTGGSVKYDGEVVTKVTNVKKGQSVTLKAVAKSGYTFVKWTSDDITISSTNAKKTTLTVTMPGKNATVTATFKKSSSHSHSYTYEYKKYDADEHKAYCSCGEWIYQDHDFEYVGNGYWKCEDCGYKTSSYYYGDHTSSHTSYKYEDYNATYHYKECKKCDYEVKEYHTWVKNTDSKTKSSYPYVCKYCERLSKTGDSDLPFHDVSNSYWYYDDVLYAYLNGLMDGISVNDFGVNEYTTRGQIVTILWRLTGEPVARKANKFTDVSSRSYYNDAISWAVDAGIVDGFDAYTFKPDANVTREQLAAILYRYAKYMNLSTKGASNLTKFDDYYSIGTWARESLAWANYHGLINGVSYSKIDPKGYATRAQVAAILHRFATEFA